MKYRYYINDVEVFPKGEWSLEYRRNEGQIFFRRIIDSELTFRDDDYDFIAVERFSGRGSFSIPIK